MNGARQSGADVDRHVDVGGPVDITVLEDRLAHVRALLFRELHTVAVAGLVGLARSALRALVLWRWCLLGGALGCLVLGLGRFLGRALGRLVLWFGCLLGRALTVIRFRLCSSLAGLSFISPWAPLPFGSAFCFGSPCWPGFPSARHLARAVGTERPFPRRPSSARWRVQCTREVRWLSRPSTRIWSWGISIRYCGIGSPEPNGAPAEWFLASRCLVHLSLSLPKTFIRTIISAAGCGTSGAQRRFRGL